jgi:glyoxylase-like metal-dependent hydrolase (beta-lactamase superfamily II)
MRREQADVKPELFESPGAFWAEYETQRFHDYSEVNTKVFREPLEVSRAVHGGAILDLDGIRVEVIDTPGYTRGAVSYWLEVGGKRIARAEFTVQGEGLHVVMADVEFDGRLLREWTEATVRVRR